MVVVVEAFATARERLRCGLSLFLSLVLIPFLLWWREECRLHSVNIFFLPFPHPKFKFPVPALVAQVCFLGGGVRLLAVYMRCRREVERVCVSGVLLII